MVTRLWAVGSVVAVTASVVVLAAQAPDRDADVVRRARAIHERVITLDTHNDIEPENFTATRNYTQRLETQVNLPKMIGLALTADDVRRIAASGRKVALIGVENAYPIGEDLRRVKEFYDRGGRYMSLAHNGNNQLSDSNTGERDGYTWKNGISPLGERVIAEMNRLGMMVDVSRPSKGSMMKAAELSTAPIIASHSAVRALCNVSRNMDDEMMKALAKTDGVMQIVAYPSYIKTPKPDSAERVAALSVLRREFGLPAPIPASGRGTTGTSAPGRGGSGRDALQTAVEGLPAAQRAAYDRRLADIDSRLPADPPATVKDFVDHIDYAVKLIGVDHVGISSDFDGGGGIDGWRDASETFNVTLELVRRGYTEEQIAKIWSGNLLRAMRRAEQVAREMQGRRSRA